MNFFDARQADEGRSFLSKKGGGNKIGEQVYRPAGQHLAPIRGIADAPVAAVGRGRPAARAHGDRRERQGRQPRVLALLGAEEGQARGRQPGNLLMAGGTKSTAELIKGTQKGILVTRTWYIRMVDPQTVLLTGLTRDGTFYIENGEIKHPVKNFRFNESPVIMLNNIEELGKPVRVAGDESHVRDDDPADEAARLHLHFAVGRGLATLCSAPANAGEGWRVRRDALSPTVERLRYRCRPRSWRVGPPDDPPRRPAPARSGIAGAMLAQLPRPAAPRRRLRLLVHPPAVRLRRLGRRPAHAVELINSLIDYTTLRVDPKEHVVALADPKMLQAPFCYLAGHKLVEFNPAERRNFERYVRNGGFVFVDDCNHDIDGLFAKSFEAQMAAIFGAKALKKLPNNHAIYRSFFKFKTARRPPRSS